MKEGQIIEVLLYLDGWLSQFSCGIYLSWNFFLCLKTFIKYYILLSLSTFIKASSMETKILTGRFSTLFNWCIQEIYYF